MDYRISGIAEESSSVVLEDPALPRPDELGLQESTVPPENTSYRLIEKFFPTDAVSQGSHTERYSGGKTPHTIFTWWARRPFAAASGVISSSLIRGEAQIQAACALVEEHCIHHDQQLTLDSLRDLIGPERQRVLDVFAGGGTIPMEAASAGVRAYSLENNELAHFIQHVLLRMSQSDTDLPELVRSCGKDFLGTLEIQTRDFYPSRRRTDGSETIAYFWSRSVQCPACQGELSLLKRPWLSKREGRQCYIARRPDKRLKRFSTHIETKGSPHEWDSAWEGRALKCPFCDHIIEDRKAQEALLMKEGFDELTALCSSAGRGHGKNQGKGKIYHEVQDRECSTLQPDDELLWAAIRTDLEAMGQKLPDARLPTWSGITNPTLYGIHRFDEMFGLRQLALLVRTCRLFRDAYPGWVEEHGELRARAIAAFLSGFIDQLADWNNRLCTWISQNEQVGRSLAGPGLPMVWDYVEIDPLVLAPANLYDKLDRIVRGIKAIPDFKHTPYVVKGDARRLPFKQKSFDVVATDPPYFDNIFYSVLSDCIYVWKKLAMDSIFPEYFKEQITNQSRELSANRYRHGDREQAALFYTEAMTEVFREIRRVLKPDGVLSLIFAHSSVGGWAAIAEAYRVARLKLVAAWPMQVERRHRPRGMNSRAVHVSFVLVARRQYHTPPAIPWPDFEAALIERLCLAQVGLEESEIFGDEQGHSLLGIGVCALSEYGSLLDVETLEAVERIACVVESLVEGFSVVRR